MQLLVVTLWLTKKQVGNKEQTTESRRQIRRALLSITAQASPPRTPTVVEACRHLCDHCPQTNSIFCGITIYRIGPQHAAMHYNNNINNNIQDNVYGAVIMAEPLREFTQFIWPPTQDQARRVRLWVCLYRLLESTPTIAIYYYYSARKLILIQWTAMG